MIPHDPEGYRAQREAQEALMERGMVERFGNWEPDLPLLMEAFTEQVSAFEAAQQCHPKPAPPE